jgi:hypothetical protein
MNLFVVSYSFEQARTFCVRQGLNFLGVPLASTDANFIIPVVTVAEEDWVVRYGPWTQGKNVHRVMAPFEEANPVMVDVYQYDERINWPHEIWSRHGGIK